MPTFPVLEDDTYVGEFLISEANNYRSREQGSTVVSTDLRAGEVLGKITATGEYVPVDPAAADGSEVAAAISLNVVSTSAAATPQQLAIAVFVRDCEVNGKILNWPATITPAEQQAAEDQLGAAGIIVRY